MITLAHLRSFTPAVLARLRTLADLPDHGTVAGQAVASLFYEELDLDVRGPVNDIDVFVSQASAGVGQALGFSSDEQEYTHIQFISLNSPIRICGTAQKGMVNTIAITHPGASDEEKHSHALSQALVDGFDINCVGVGINLHTQQVVASAHFVQFLNTKQMEITTTLTPAHSLVRLSKKAFGNQFRNVRCDYTAQRNMIDDFLALRQSPAFAQMTDACTETFGDKYKGLVEQHPERFPAMEAAATFYRFVAGACSVDASDVIDALQGCKKPMQAFALLHNFPSLWRVLNSSPSQPQKKTQLVGALTNATSDGQQFSAVHQALFGLPLLQNVALPDNDCAVFFLQCSDRFNSTQVNTIVDSYNRLSPLEKTVFSHQQGTADTVLDFDGHKRERVQQWFENTGVWALAQLGHVVWNDEHAQRLVELVDHCVGKAWSASSIEEALDRHGDLKGFSRSVRVLFANLPPSYRSTLANTLFSTFSWVDLPLLPRAVAFNILLARHWADLPLDEALAVGGTQGVVEPLAREIAQSTQEPSAVQLANVEKMLKHVSSRVWLEGPNPLLVEFLKTNCCEAAVRHKTSLLGDGWNGERIAQVRQRLDDPLLVARLDHLVLALEVGMDNAQVAPRRKM